MLKLVLDLKLRLFCVSELSECKSPRVFHCFLFKSGEGFLILFPPSHFVTSSFGSFFYNSFSELRGIGHSSMVQFVSVTLSELKCLFVLSETVFIKAFPTERDVK